MGSIPIPDTIMETTEFQPNWVSPPGDTLFDIANERNQNIIAIGEKLGLDLIQTTGLLDGTFSVTPELADKMAIEYGATPEFWLKRQLQYDEDKLRLKL